MSKPCPRRKHSVFHLIKAIARLLLPRHQIIGAENVEKLPAVFICNHAGVYGPVVMEICFPIPFRPWVIYDVMTPGLCRHHLEEDFTEKELGLHPPLSQWLAAVIEPLCRLIMGSAEAVPVYKGSMKIRQTFDLSMDALQSGDNLLIFPENPEKKYSESLNEFQTGFIRLSKLYFAKVGKPLNIYLVFVNKKRRTITIAKPAEIAGADESGDSEERLKNYFQKTMEDMAR